MSENKDFDQQDFIEQGDDFAETMDDNFDAPQDPMADEHIINVDAVDEPLESFEDEWAEDFDEVDDGELLDDDLAAMAQKPQKNWFNIIVFGVVAIVICVMGYNYILPYFSSSNGQSSQPQGGVAVQSQDLAQAGSPEQNALLMQQALSANEADTTSILDNPSLLGDGLESVERPDPEAADNAVFEALGNVPQMSESDVDDIFAAIDQAQLTQDATTQPQQLPLPADDVVDVDILPTVNILETNQQEPRMPKVETGVEELGDLVANQQLPATPTASELPTESSAQMTNNNAEMTAMNERMDLIMARLESLTDKVETIADSANAEPIFAAPSENNGSSEKVEKLEKTIQSLEKKITNLSKKKASAPVKKTSSRKVTSRKQPTPKKTTQWTLRGASPGQAFVAEKGTQNLRTVNVGDHLKGLGRIQSIAIEGGHWVVRGTSGLITQ